VKFDKQTIAVFAACILLLIIWDPFCRYMGWIQPTPPATASQTADKPATAAPAATPTPTTTAAAATPATPAPTAPVATVAPANNNLKALPNAKIGNNDLTMEIDPNQGIISAVTLKKYQNNDRKSLVEFKSQLQPGALAVVPVGNWTLFKVVPQNIGSSEFRLHRFFSSGNSVLEITQTWHLAPSYQYHYEVTVNNAGQTQLTLPELEIFSQSLEPMEQQSGDNIRTESHGIDYCSDSTNSIDADAKDATFNIALNSPVHWISIRNKYFAAIIKPEKEFAGMKTSRTRQTVNNKQYYVVAASGLYKNIVLDPGQNKSFGFSGFVGPKEINFLTAFDPQTQYILHLSFVAPMEWISKMLLKFLIMLKDLCCGSYGWAIIVLTIIVRLLLWPVTQKANNSMKKMQKLQPMIQDIRAKHKDNPQVMNTKIMELYREQHVNPLGGCLPILLQIPVFIALYSTIDSAAELRHVSFMWAKDLAQPDTVASIMGFGINPLVLVMTALMVLQQKMTPSPMDPMQQKMMLIMPVVMLIFLYSLPSGLTLYWTVSQIFSIFQLLMTQKFSADDDTTVNLPKKA